MDGTRDVRFDNGGNLEDFYGSMNFELSTPNGMLEGKQFAIWELNSITRVVKTPIKEFSVRQSFGKSVYFASSMKAESFSQKIAKTHCI